MTKTRLSRVREGFSPHQRQCCQFSHNLFPLARPFNILYSIHTRAKIHSFLKKRSCFTALFRQHCKWRGHRHRFLWKAKPTKVTPPSQAEKKGCVSLILNPLQHFFIRNQINFFLKFCPLFNCDYFRFIFEIYFCIVFTINGAKFYRHKCMQNTTVILFSIWTLLILHNFLFSSILFFFDK